MLTLGSLDGWVDGWVAVGHVSYLVAVVLVGWYVAITGFTKRLSQ